MCLGKLDLEKTRELKDSPEKIIAYKIVNPDLTAIYNPYQWKLGENISNRQVLDLTKEEIEFDEVSFGFHFFLDLPEVCQYPYQYQYPCPDPGQCRCPYAYRYPYRCPYGQNKTLKVEIQPGDIIAVGSWNNESCIVATKATVTEILKII